MQKFLDHSSDATTMNIPIGFPVTDTTVYLLKSDNTKASVYQYGEIVHKSEYLSIGYWNNEQQTAAVFVSDPVTGMGRTYRSGDLGRLLPTGEIEFIGRKDQQVKLNGQRIELSEIEQNLLKIEGVDEAAVLVKNLHEKDQVIAYIRSVKKITEAWLKQKLALSLPFHMLPSLYIFLDVFPLTPTGKINRMALPEPIMEDYSKVYLPPRNLTEQKLTTLFEEILGKEKIGVLDNYFEMGGNSLSTLKILSRIREQFQINFKMEEVFLNSTIEDLAKEVNRKIWALTPASTSDKEVITVSM